MSEEWRTIAEFPDYSVSDHGRIRRDTPYASKGGRRHVGMIIKPMSGQLGHQRVCLYRDAVMYRRLVHRLLAVAFELPRRPDQDEVAHNDSNPRNNHISNLRWATKSENFNDKIANGTAPRGQANGMNRRTGLTEEAVREIRRMREDDIPYAEIEKRFGINKVTACAIVKRRNWKHVA